jgi:exopolysaccharide production protein ExoQ
VFTRLFERLFVVVVLLSSMGVVDALTRPTMGTQGPEVMSTEVPLPTALTEAGVYVCAALLVLMRWRRVLSAARTVWPLVAFAALAPLSIAWSIQPILTLRKSVLVMASTVVAIYLGERYSTEKLARLLAQTLCLMMLAVVVLYFVAPAYVIDYTVHIGAWKGLSGGKNVFGACMALAFALLLLVRFRHFRWLRYVFLLPAAVLLVLSHSATSLLCCVLLVAAMPLWRLTRAHGEHRLLVYTMTALAFSLGIYLILENTDLLFQILGRDSTLTGRTHLWHMVIPAIVKHPILGYGYGAFWTGLKGESLNVWIGTGWLAPAADNGYLDLCLGIGVLGVPVFVYVFLRSFRMAIEYLRCESGPVALWPVTYLCFFGLHNVTESHLLTTRSLEFLMFQAITTSLALNRQPKASASPTADSERPAAISGSPHSSSTDPWFDNIAFRY